MTDLEFAITVMVWAVTVAIVSAIGIAFYIVRKEF